MLIALLSSCFDEGFQDPAIPRKQLFEFSYEISRTDYRRGEEIKINAIVMNISGRELKTYLYFPSIELYYLNDKGEIGGKLDHQIMPNFDAVEQTVEKGGIGSYTYVFPIPEIAHCGEYSIRLWYGEESRVFENVLRITDDTSQNENEEYQYSPISVSSDGNTINPIRTVSSFYVQNADGTSALGCDGMGVWKYFGEADTDISTFPLLVYNGSIGVYVPEYTEIQGVEIYDLECNRLNGYSSSSIKELEYLSAGDYIVVLSVKYDTRPRNPDSYEQYDYDDFFRLTVPSKNDGAKAEYDYSSVLIKSGDFEIRPIQCMLWVEEHKKGESLSGDGFGVFKIIENKEDHTDFPTLFYKGNLQVYPPVNVNLYTAKVQVYDTDYNELKYSFDRIEDIRELLPGEYLIVFREVIDGSGCDPDITEYSVWCNECIFKFIVPESSLGSFSFDRISKEYKAGDPGVKTEGFKNTSEQALTNSAEAVERAKTECTIEYDAVTVLRDGWDKMWSVTFSTRNTLGGCQTVYLDSNGITLLIVYGE